MQCLNDELMKLDEYWTDRHSKIIYENEMRWQVDLKRERRKRKIRNIYAM
jgi:hypothetical protein